MSKPRRVFVRTYCEASCPCETCHDGHHSTEVEECVYCQLAWYGKGQFSKSFLAENKHITHKETLPPRKKPSAAEDALYKIKRILEEL